jgi:hypothetical protein
MSKGILSLLFIGVLFSCKRDKCVDMEAPVEHQKLQLIRMSGNIPNSTTTGDKMPWQEFYSLNPDSTFVKSRTVNKVTDIAGGKYHVAVGATATALTFTYDSMNNLIGNCTGNKVENLTLTGNEATSFWSACDGPGLVYVWAN